MDDTANRVQRLRQALEARLTSGDSGPLLSSQCATDVQGVLTGWASGGADASAGEAWTVAYVLWYRFQLGAPPRYDREIAVALDLFGSLIGPDGPVVAPAVLGAIGRGPVLDRASSAGAMHAAMGAARAMSADRPSAGAEVLRRALSRAPADPAAQGPALVLLGVLLRLAGEPTADTRMLDEAVMVGRAAVEGFPALDPWLPAARSELVNTLLSRFDTAGAQADLDEAVAAAEIALDESPTSPLGRHMFFTGLTFALFRRARWTGSSADLDRAINAGRDAVRLPHATPAAWGNLAVALALRAERAGRSADLDEALAMYRAAREGHGLDSVPLTVVVGFADSLRARAQRTGAVADVTEAVAVLRSAGAARDALLLSSLCAALVTRAELTGEAGDLDDAVDAGRAAAQWAPPRALHALTNLGHALVTRYEQAGNAADLAEAVSVHRSVVARTPGDSPDLGRHLTNLANALRQSYGQAGDAAALEEAVEAARRAVEATPASHAEYPGYLTNWAAALQDRVTARYSEADMTKMTDLLRSAVAISAAPEERAVAASTLSRVLRLRFERAGARADLAEAVTAARLSVSVTGARGPRYPVRLLGLADVLRVMSRTDRDPMLADEAVETSRSALGALASLPAGHRSRTAALSQLSGCLINRARLRDRTDELGEALLYARQARQETQPDDPHLALRIANLVAAHSALATKGSPGERSALIAAMREAAAQLDDGSPYRAPALVNLGVMLYGDATGRHAGPDRLEAIDTWRQAAQAPAAASMDRLQAAYRWGAGAFHAALVELAAAGYAYAAGLLPQVAWHGIEARERQRVDAEWQGLAGEAAAAALTAQSAPQAVELLEGTRGVAWTQLLELRSDLTRLGEQHPDLAGRLTRIRLDLDTRDAGRVDPPEPALFR